MAKKPADKYFFTIALILTLAGFFIFSSASLGLLARGNGTYGAVAVNQGISLVIGLILMAIAARVPYQFWNKYALHILLASLAITALVFIPHIGFAHGGARRWLLIGPFTFQPAEVLKLGFIIYFAAWIGGVRQKITTFRFGILPLVILLALCGGLLILQPDVGTFLLITLAGVTMLYVAGGNMWHMLALGAAGSVTLFILSIFKAYIKARVITFFNPALDPQGAGYQIQQSLIAIGSGKFFGRGFGQSIQKFNFLPEPVGDSIFAVFAEEWGFVGGVALLILFLLLFLRGIKIAARAPNIFSATLVTGIVTMIIAQSFMNIASMLGVFPLTGDPLAFVSQGGSALIVVLVEVGIVLNISKQQKTA